MIPRPVLALRPATAADLHDRAALFGRIRCEIFTWDAARLCSPAEFAATFAGEDQVLAWVGPQLAGFVSVFRADSFVHGLYVLPEWQGQGIGRQLLAAGLAGMTGAARLKCNLGNTRARRFYEHQGWREVARDGSRPADWILYIHAGQGSGPR